jgi:RecA-family ATPase
MRKIDNFEDRAGREEPTQNGQERNADRAAPPSLDVWAFLDEPEPERDELIPGALDRLDRVLITGDEGKGKSTLLRQISVQTGAGIHPFTGADIDPIRTYLADYENSRAQSRRALRPLALSAGRDRLRPGQLEVDIRPEGLDLLRLPDADDLLARVAAHRTDLLILGPLYKLASGDPTTEEVARTVALRLDRIRTECSCAVLIEAHTPHASTPGGKRPQRPYGASLWLRWPEFGIHLSETGALTHWRGPRDERDWPAALQRGGEWPWSPAEPKVATWALIVEACREAGAPLSLRRLEERLPVSKSTIERAIHANRAEWDRLAEDLAEGEAE